MQRAFDWIFGLTAVLLGLALAAWLLYNFLVERQEASEGRNPLPAVGLTGVCLFVGIHRLRLAIRGRG